MAVDNSQLIALQKRLQAAVNGGTDNVCEDACKELASRLLRKCKQKTPVGQYPTSSGKMGGTLRRGWTVSQWIQMNEDGKAGDTKTVKADKNAHELTVFNPTEYASYVEYGHRAPNGRWVQGQFFMTESVHEMNDQVDAILRKKSDKYLRGIFQ